MFKTKQFLVAFIATLVVLCFSGICVFADDNLDNETAVSDEGSVMLADEHVHTITKVEAVAADCENDGNTEYWFCPDCGELFGDEEGTVEIEVDSWVISALGHDWDEGEIVTEPTTSSEGQKKYTCKRCGETRSETIEKLPSMGDPHELINIDGVYTYLGEDGNPDYTYNGIASNGAGTWLITNGKVTFTETGVVDGKDGNWYYAKNGRVLTEYTGIRPNSNGWWRIVDGKVDLNCNTVAQNENGWWYCKDGKVQFAYNGIASNGAGTWLITNGKVLFTENGVVSGKDGNWYYAKNGRVVTEYTGIKPNSNGWWRIVNGIVDFSCNSVEHNENGWWYCKNGKVQFNYTGIQPNHYGWWRIVNGKVDFGATGVFENENGWWYCKNGEVQFGYSGIKSNKNGWWRIENGKVDFKANGVFRNDAGWWYCKNGKVQFNYTGIQPNQYGWWRIVNGKVDFGATGVFENENGWWYCKNGEVQFDFTGAATNSNGRWYIDNGKVDFKKTGVINMTVNGTTGNWVVRSGRVLGLEKDIEVLNLAAARLDAIGWNISSAYRWSVNIKYQHDQVGNTTTSNAVYSFKTSIADCVGKASTFYWMAKLLGYDVKVIMGRVPLLRGGWSEHAWCEMYVNGKTNVVDPTFEYQERRNGYMIQYRQSGTWRYDSGSPMSD